MSSPWIGGHFDEREIGSIKSAGIDQDWIQLSETRANPFSPFSIHHLIKRHHRHQQEQQQQNHLYRQLLLPDLFLVRVQLLRRAIHPLNLRQHCWLMIIRRICTIRRLNRLSKRNKFSFRSSKPFSCTVNLRRTCEHTRFSSARRRTAVLYFGIGSSKTNSAE